MNQVVDFGAMFKRLARTGNANIMTSLAGQGTPAAKSSARGRQTFQPSELVIEFGTGLGVSVRSVDQATSMPLTAASR